MGDGLAHRQRIAADADLLARLLDQAPGGVIGRRADQPTVVGVLPAGGLATTPVGAGRDGGDRSAADIERRLDGGAVLSRDASRLTGGHRRAGALARQRRGAGVGPVVGALRLATGGGVRRHAAPAGRLVGKRRRVAAGHLHRRDAPGLRVGVGVVDRGADLGSGVGVIGDGACAVVEPRAHELGRNISRAILADADLSGEPSRRRAALELDAHLLGAGRQLREGAHRPVARTTLDDDLHLGAADLVDLHGPAFVARPLVVGLARGPDGLGDRRPGRIVPAGGQATACPGQPVRGSSGAGESLAGEDRRAESLVGLLAAVAPDRVVVLRHA